MWDFTFKGTSALTLGFTTFKKYIPDLPDIEETNINIPGVDGIFQVKKKFCSRVISVKGILEGESYADLLTKIEAFNEFLYSEVDEQLIFNDQLDRFYKAQKLENEEIDRKAISCDRLLKFKCNDPFGYAVEPDVSNELAITDKDHTWEIKNGGQYYAWPVITITFNQPQTHIYIINNNMATSGFDISKSFGAGDVLRLDTKEITIKLNGESLPAGFGDGGEGRAEFILLVKGENELQIGTDDATTPPIDVDVNVTFRKVYL